LKKIYKNQVPYKQSNIDILKMIMIVIFSIISKDITTEILMNYDILLIREQCKRYYKGIAV
ncbi:MAG: hypothetical protein ACFFDN_21695, partial [Candidatus Hodarchaeota archaeon]